MMLGPRCSAGGRRHRSPRRSGELPRGVGALRRTWRRPQPCGRDCAVRDLLLMLDRRQLRDLRSGHSQAINASTAGDDHHSCNTAPRSAWQVELELPLELAGANEDQAAQITEILQHECGNLPEERSLLAVAVPRIPSCRLPTAACAGGNVCANAADLQHFPGIETNFTAVAKGIVHLRRHLHDAQRRLPAVDDDHPKGPLPPLGHRNAHRRGVEGGPATPRWGARQWLTRTYRLENLV
mmetsp:Transcript_42795/g.124409  ORF Transcript_42795/g.124409 Transcript_42795/m.124409 type:complete len:239 (+) Transcript_42795:645-1361(+)